MGEDGQLGASEGRAGRREPLAEHPRRRQMGEPRTSRRLIRAARGPFGGGRCARRHVFPRQDKSARGRLERPTREWGGGHAPISALGGDTALVDTVLPLPSLPVLSCAFSPRLDGEDERTARHRTADLEGLWDG